MASVYSSPGWVGYWVSPAGKAFRVETSHISDVLGQCEKFGLSRAMLDHLRTGTCDGVPLSAEDQKTLMDSLLQTGWVAIHHYPGQGWAAELWELSNEARQRLAAFFLAMGCTPEDREPVRIQTKNAPLVARMAQLLRQTSPPAQSEEPDPRHVYGQLIFVDSAQAIPDEEIVLIVL